MSRPNRRQHIEQAAIALFAEKGSAATSVREIAQAAGLTEAALYRHFSGKENLIVSLFQSGMAQLVEGLLPILNAPLPPSARIEQAVAYMLEAYTGNTQYITFLLFDLHAFPQNDSMYQTPQNPTDMVCAFIRTHCPGRDANLYAGMVMGMIIQPLILHRYGRLTLSAHTAPAIAASIQGVLGL